MNEELTLLALCDSPTATSGFARVAMNLLPKWHKKNGGIFDKIVVWGINYRGEQHDFPVWILPPGEGYTWQATTNLTLFVALACGMHPVHKHKVTHIWMMQDSFIFSQTGFSKALSESLAKNNPRAKTVYYMPVDSSVEAAWMEAVQSADVPVAYTEYGRNEALKKLPRKFNPATLRVIPHGCDTSIYRPMEDPEKIRRELFHSPNSKPFVESDDFLIVNCNANQVRKDIPSTLKIFAGLGKLVPGTERRYKLVLQMPKLSSDGVDLGVVMEQLGLTKDDVYIADQHYNAGFAKHPESYIADLYNASDLMLTSTLGEGWGFCLTEAAACGCPVMAPDHTACSDVMDGLSTRGVKGIYPVRYVANSVVHRTDNSRYRPSIDVPNAIENIHALAMGKYDWDVKAGDGDFRPSSYKTRNAGKLCGLTAEAKDWLGWNRIAKEWEGIFTSL